MLIVMFKRILTLFVPYDTGVFCEERVSCVVSAFCESCEGVSCEVNVTCDVSTSCEVSVTCDVSTSCEVRESFEVNVFCDVSVVCERSIPCERSVLHAFLSFVSSLTSTTDN